MITSWRHKAESMLGRSRGPKRVPDGTRFYAIGDIHGRADLLVRMHELIERDSVSAAPETIKTVIYLGDYVDRGPSSYQVIDMLIDSPLPGFETIHLKGNHEEMLLGFLEDPTLGLAWRDYGGLETMESYDATKGTLESNSMAFDAACDALAAHMPESHLTFLNELLPCTSFGDYFFAHAGIKPGVPFEDQKEQDLLWIRRPFLESTKDFGKIVVHGHTADRNIANLENRIGVDTGAFMTNVLTCVILEGAERRFLQTKA